MGWQIERFPTKPADELLCGICKCVFEDAVASPCGHTFCLSCLVTWLERACTKTCPQCRKGLRVCDVIPIYSLRQVVNKICIYCENRHRGCTFISRLEDVTKHAGYCGYAAKSCDQCGVTVNRKDLSKHRDTCQSQTAVGEMEETTDQINGNFEKKLEMLEIQFKHAKKKLELCEADNRKLKREILVAKSALETRSNIIGSSGCAELSQFPLKVVTFDDLSPEAISRLSLLIASSLRIKPLHVNADQVFVRIRHHYENYARCGNCFEYDVNMLVATAYASTWFSGEQRVLLHHWMERIARYRKYTNIRRGELAVTN